MFVFVVFRVWTLTRQHNNSLGLPLDIMGDGLGVLLKSLDIAVTIAWATIIPRGFSLSRAVVRSHPLEKLQK